MTDRRDLGMDRNITRRDFLNGVRIAVGASLLPSAGTLSPLFAQEAAYAPEKQQGYYPPAKTGMRGAHDGSWEVAHSAVAGKTWPDPARLSEEYDLIVVGAGISGLSAAYFYRQAAGPDAKILILDNHDDFGGHAKRNEFRPVSGGLLIGYGGTQTITSPNLYSAQAKQLFADLGIQVHKFETSYDRKFYSSRNLKGSTFFDKETFGSDRLVRGFSLENINTEILAQTPLAPNVQRDLLRLCTEKKDYLAGKSAEEKKSYLARTSYRNYLLNDVQVDPGVIPLFQTSTYGLYGVGIDAVPAGDMAGLGMLPGFAGLGIQDVDGPGIGLEVTRRDDEPYIYHFPDGIGSVPRLLVRALIPATASGHTMEDVVLAKFDYSKLDTPSAATQIRLNSTVIHAKNSGQGSAAAVEVTFVRGGQAYVCRGKHAIMACWNSFIPYLCPEMSDAQKRGLAYNVKVPLVYTNVQIRNWTSFSKLGIHAAHCPGSFFNNVDMDFPVSIGGYEFTHDPEQPCVIHLQMVPVGAGQTAREQQRSGRAILLGMEFATFEHAIRDQMSRILAAGGFDPARDIEAITVNRWPHGYAYEYNSLFDPVWKPGEAPNEIGRKPFGRIHIANSDAGAFAYTNEAIDQGYRAADEITAGNG